MNSFISEMISTWQLILIKLKFLQLHAIKKSFSNQINDFTV